MSKTETAHIAASRASDTQEDGSGSTGSWPRRQSVEAPLRLVAPRAAHADWDWTDHLRRE